MVLIVPNTYLVSINAESGGQAVTNVIGIRKEFSDSSEVANAVLTAWNVTNGPRSQWQNTTAMRDVTAMFLGQADGEVDIVPSSLIGGLTQQKSTNAACALVTFGSGSRSRSTKGRMYFGPLGESMIDADGRTVAAVYRTSITTAFTNFKSNLDAAGFEWVVISRKLQSAVGINTIATQSIIATQRRRIR